MEIEDRVLRFVEEGISALREDEGLKIIAKFCPRCGTPIRFPVIARREDVEHVQLLINILSAYLKESGAFDDMYQKLRDKIELALIIRKAEGEEKKS